MSKKGVIEYDKDGLPKCEICGNHFSRVLTHVRQKHGIDKREYKIMFGFDLVKGICSKKSSELTREKTLANYDKCIKQNLEIKGSTTRFSKGDKGRTKEMVSDQTRLMLKKRLKQPKMIEAMQKNAAILGKSQAGNNKRWGAKSEVKEIKKNKRGKLTHKK